MVQVTLRYSDLAGNNDAITGATTSSGVGLAGAGTSYVTDLVVGDFVKGPDGQVRQIASITDATHAAVTAALSPDWSGVALQRFKRQTFNAKLVHGFDPADRFVNRPAIIQAALDGTLTPQNLRARRRFRVVLGVEQIYTDRWTIGSFMASNMKFLCYTHDGIVETNVRVVPAQNKFLVEAVLLDKSSIERSITIDLIEATPFTAFPS